MKRHFALLAFWYFGAAASLCFADDKLTVDTVPKDMARRVELQSGRTYPEARNGPLRPERLYTVYEPLMEGWIYTVTDDRGRLAHPIEALSPGTVLEGDRLGGEPGKRYLLSPKAKWEATQRPLQRRFWLVKRPPEFRIYLPVNRTVEVARPEPGAGVDRRPAAKPNKKK